MNASDGNDDERCPVCGEPVTSVTVIGPDEAIVSPCGHVIDPAVLD